MSLTHLLMKTKKILVMLQETSSENELQEDYNRPQESSSDDPEVFSTP